jgi:CheY-like chemotaxis protein
MPERLARPQQPRNLLIIVCDQAVRQVTRLLAESVGFEVVEAADGEAALEAVRRRPPDLVLCDVHLPRLSGLEVVRQFRSEFPAVPVVALGDGGQDWPEDGPVVTILGKPFGRRKLLDAIARALTLAEGPPPADRQRMFPGPR